MGALIARLQEPSSWASLATLLIGAGVAIPQEIVGNVASALAAVAGIVGFFLREKGGK